MQQSQGRARWPRELNRRHFVQGTAASAAAAMLSACERKQDTTADAPPGLLAPTPSSARKPLAAGLSRDAVLGMSFVDITDQAGVRFHHEKVVLDKKLDGIMRGWPPSAPRRRRWIATRTVT